MIMWQRKQTIYLLLVTILLLTLQVLPLMFFNTTANISASATGLQGMPRELYCAMIYNPAVNTQDGSQYTVGTVTLLAVVSVAAAIISFASIFIFKNRKRQMEVLLKGYNEACDSLNHYGVKKYMDVIRKHYNLSKQAQEKLPDSLKFNHAAAPRQKDVERAHQWLLKTIDEKPLTANGKK